MQVNQTQQFNYPVILSSPFTVDSATLQVTGPDGSQSNVNAVVSPNTSSTTQNLSAFFTPTLGGKYNALWKPVVAGNILSYPFNFFATWTPAYDSVRTYLGGTSASFAETIIDTEFINQDTLVHNYSNGLPPYFQMNKYTDLVSNLYSQDYDTGLALLVAAELRIYTGPKKPSGEITLFKKGTTTVQYTAGSKTSDISIEDQWREKGWSLLEACIAEIKTAAAQDRSGDEIMTRGRRANNVRKIGPNDGLGFGFLGGGINYGQEGNWEPFSLDVNGEM